MATPEQRELSAAATARERGNPNYKSSSEVLKAVDAVLIKKEQLKSATLIKLIAASFERFVAWVKCKSRSHATIADATNAWLHSGTVEQADEYFAVQNQGRGNYIIHDQTLLDKTLFEGQFADIRYSNGRGTVELIDRSKGKGGIAD